MLIERDKLIALASRAVGLGNRPHSAPAVVEEEYDLFVYAASWLRDIVELRRLKDWRKRCGKAVLFMFECWPHDVKDNGPLFRELREFDLVVYISPAATDALRAASGATMAYVRCGANTEILCPYPHAPSRSIDVNGHGRQPQAQHEALLAMAQSNPDFFYLYDTSAGAYAIDFPRHAALRASLLKRSRIFPCYGLNAVDSRKSGESKGYELTPMRFYDAAACGAFVIGEPPNTAEYRADFDWEDAHAFVAGRDGAYVETVSALLREPERLARAGARGVEQALRRHDWAHRWAEILELLRLDPKPALEARVARLEALTAHCRDEATIMRGWTTPAQRTPAKRLA